MSQPDHAPLRDKVVSSGDSGVVPAARRSRRLRLLVLGVGNILMSDDGVGVHAVNEFKRKPRAGVLVTEVGTAILDAVDLLAWADRVIVIDALHAQGVPGTIYWASFSEILHQPGNLSLHELDLSAALAFVPRGAQRPEIFVLGIQPGSLEMGLELSAPVAAAMPQVLVILDRKVMGWRKARLLGQS